MSNKKKWNKQVKNQKPRDDYDALGVVRVERSGFPIRIAHPNGGVEEFFFSTSEENLANYVEMLEDPDAFVAKIQAAENSVTLEVEDGEIPTLQEFNEFIGSRKDATRILIDTTLGKGSFDRMYDMFHDLRAITNVYPVVMDTVTRGLEIHNRKEKRAEQDRRNNLADYKASKRSK